MYVRMYPCGSNKCKILHPHRYNFNVFVSGMCDISACFGDHQTQQRKIILFIVYIFCHACVCDKTDYVLCVCAFYVRVSERASLLGCVLTLASACSSSKAVSSHLLNVMCLFLCV